MKIFNQEETKHYKAQDGALTIKSICWATVAIFALVVILGKMEEDKISFVSKQFIKHQELRK